MLARSIEAKVGIVRDSPSTVASAEVFIFAIMFCLNMYVSIVTIGSSRNNALMIMSVDFLRDYHRNTMLLYCLTMTFCFYFSQPFQLEINDYPQHARWKATHKDALAPIQEFTGCAITTKGRE